MVSYLLILIPSLLFVCLLVCLFVFLSVLFSLCLFAVLFLSLSVSLSLCVCVCVEWVGEDMGVRGGGGGESVTANLA